MFRNSLDIRMSAHPYDGQGLVLSASQIPEKSGLPSAVLGVGAPKFGTPLGVFGTPAVGYCSHWADSITGIAKRTAARMVTYDPG
jgi:hypothetical protein